MSKVYYSRVSAVVDHLFVEKCKDRLSAHCRQRVESFCFAEDRIRTVLGERLALYGIYEHCRVDESHVVLVRSKWGKPYAVGLPCYFNISHSGDYVVCAFSQEDIGIDIEQVKEMDLNFAPDVLSEEELSLLSGVSGTDKRQLFFTLWTLKESYVKWLGTGFRQSPASYSFRLTGREAVVAVANSKEIPELKVYRLGDCVLSICQTGSSFPERLQYLAPQDLLPSLT